MERIPIERPDAPSRLRDVLSRGGVVVVPTDTLYGFSAVMSSRDGYERIVSIKRTESGHRFLYLASGVDMVERYVDGWGCVPRPILEAVWPAPLTAVLRSGDRCPDWLGETAAFRVPRHSLLRSVIDALGEPILSTSVNESGKPPLGEVDAIEERFGAFVDLIVDGGALAGGAASTLIDFTGEAPAVLRQGDYVWDGAGNPSK